MINTNKRTSNNETQGYKTLLQKTPSAITIKKYLNFVKILNAKLLLVSCKQYAVVTE